MEKLVKFEVPADVLGDFVQEINRNGFTATSSGPNRRGEYAVTISYDKEQEEEIDSLQEYLDDLVSDLNAEDKEE